MKTLATLALALPLLFTVDAATAAESLTPDELALRDAKTALDRACIRYGGRDLSDCREQAKHCSEPHEFLRWAWADCRSAAVVACWRKGLRGNKLDVCADDYLDKHPIPDPTSQ